MIVLSGFTRPLDTLKHATQGFPLHASLLDRTRGLARLAISMFVPRHWPILMVDLGWRRRADA